MDMKTVTNRDKAIIRELLGLWEASVRETHTFLPETMIKSLRPMVEEALAGVGTLLAARDEDGAAAAFIGIEADKIEMLFVHPAARGKGIGKSLVHHACDVYHCRNVDVNEQNIQAVGFYKKMGFRVTGRSELDGQGNPYPLLHMEI